MDLSNETLTDLLRSANDAKQNSYSPYSKFRVGAALLADDGKVFMGTNVENASYGILFNLILRWDDLRRAKCVCFSSESRL